MKISTNALLLLILGVALIAPNLSGSRQMEVIGHEKLADGLLAQTKSGKLLLRPMADDMVRVTFTSKDDFSDHGSLVVVSKPGPNVEWSVEGDEDAVRLVMGKIIVEVDRGSGALAFIDSSGEILLSEPDRNSQGLHEARA